MIKLNIPSSNRYEKIQYKTFINEKNMKLNKLNFKPFLKHFDRA